MAECPPQLFSALLNGTHEASLSFRREYGLKLIERLKPMIPLLSFPEDHPERLNFNWAEKKAGRAPIAMVGLGEYASKEEAHPY